MNYDCTGCGLILSTITVGEIEIPGKLIAGSIISWFFYLGSLLPHSSQTFSRVRASYLIYAHNIELFITPTYYIINNSVVNTVHTIRLTEITQNLWNNVDVFYLTVRKHHKWENVLAATEFALLKMRDQMNQFTLCHFELQIMYRDSLLLQIMYRFPLLLQIICRVPLLLQMMKTRNHNRALQTHKLILYLITTTLPQEVVARPKPKSFEIIIGFIENFIDKYNIFYNCSLITEWVWTRKHLHLHPTRWWPVVKTYHRLPIPYISTSDQNQETSEDTKF